MKVILLSFVILLASGCSVFGESNVEIAPYQVIESAQAQNIEIRTYDRMVLVSTPMDGESRNGAFRRLFNYISGENVAAQDIAMTAPVFMDDREQGVEIPMTAPVFMDAKENKGSSPMMSFVMPASFTLQTTPKPTNPDVKVEEIKDYRVAVITFNGRLNESNTTKHRAILEQWITEQGHKTTGPAKTAGYNPPMTLPHLRRNEVLIPVE